MKKIFLSTMLAGAAIAANAQSVSSISNSKDTLQLQDILSLSLQDLTSV